MATANFCQSKKEKKNDNKIRKSEKKPKTIPKQKKHTTFASTNIVN